MSVAADPSIAGSANAEVGSAPIGFPPKRVIRTACDLCHKRKRRCDGKDGEPCAGCVALQVKCTFSERRRTGPKRKAIAQDAPALPGGSGSGEVITSHAGWFSQPRPLAGYRNTVQSPRHLQIGTVASVPASLAPPQPGAPLVFGSRENHFITSYFYGCGLFGKFLGEATIRDVMLELMCPPSEADLSGAASSWYTSSLRKGHVAAHSTFWTTMGLGATLSGFSQRETLMGYLDRARKPLFECMDQCDTGTAMAHQLLAYFCETLGDTPRWSMYRERAMALYQELEAEGDRRPKAQKETLGVTMADLRFMVYAAHDLHHMMYGGEEFMTHIAQGVNRMGHVADSLFAAQESMSTGLGGRPNVTMMLDGELLKSMLSCRYIIVRAFYRDALLARSGLENDERFDVPGPVMRAEALLSAVADKTEGADSVRTGWGALTLYMAIFLARCMQGKPREQMLASMDKCQQVLQEFPGLLRIKYWRHMAHCMAMAFRVCEERWRYDKLRHIYNNTSMLFMPQLEDPLPDFDIPEEELLGRVCCHWHCKAWWSLLCRRRRAICVEDLEVYEEEEIHLPFLPQPAPVISRQASREETDTYASPEPAPVSTSIDWGQYTDWLDTGQAGSEQWAAPAAFQDLGASLQALSQLDRHAAMPHGVGFPAGDDNSVVQGFDPVVIPSVGLN